MSHQGFSQQGVYLSFTSPLGKDALLLHAFHGEEHLSAPFHLTLELHSARGDVNFNQLVGKGASISLSLADGSFRYLHGLVTRFVQAGTRSDFTTYYAELRPWLWLLTLTRDSRIFQNMTVPRIVEKVFKDSGFSDFRLALKGTYAPREYCVQHQESSFDFVSRLLEDEGIFYFFEHTDSKHVLVLADDPSAHASCPGLKQARVGRHGTSILPDDTITECTLEQRVTSTAYQLVDFNFETPANKLRAELASGTPVLKVYEYPGGFLQKGLGDSRVKRRLEEQRGPEKSLRGQGRVRAFIPGYRFTLADHERPDVNGAYVLRWLSHSASVEQYTSSFEAFPASVTFRPPRVTPRPRISGAQTAIVVGKAGEEIWTDEHGRVKVQFHWDQQGKKDENSSCWIRVAQGWAGKAWGSIFLPRMGQEVLVTFLDGDPDRPLITGSIYNGEQTVPYPLPAERTKSTVKSHSSKGGGGFNELRFEDKKGQEEIFVHAQKDMRTVVENDWAREVGHDDTTVIKNARTTTIQQADEKLVVEKGNRVVQVRTGNETHEVMGQRSLKVTGNEDHTNQADFTHEVKGNYTLRVTGNLLIDVVGDVTLQSAKNLMTKAGMNLTDQAGVSLTNKAGVSLTNDGGASLTSKASATQTVDGGGLLTLKGGLVKIN
ncbi:type VI secretion system Vgr family protein [Archangium sp.]|jgi:type VI secretion system secreted protein VgrG|uniref:type VI secretion system Vgr family protein n=1 Tax=Archangium sp. TaxID=1872627 RepID=UPI002EDB0B9F